MEDDLKMFQLFLKDKSIDRKTKNKILRQYARSLGMKGTGKKSGKLLVNDIIQAGGSWSGFKNFFKKVGNAVASAGKFVYNKAIKPAVEAIKDKPLSTIGKAATVAGMIPSPWSGALKTAGTALTSVDKAVGKGQEGGRSRPVILFD